MSLPITNKQQILAELLEAEGRKTRYQPMAHQRGVNFATGPVPDRGTAQNGIQLAMSSTELQRAFGRLRYETEAEALNAAIASIRAKEKEYAEGKDRRSKKPVESYRAFITEASPMFGSGFYSYTRPLPEEYPRIRPEHKPITWIVGEGFNPDTNYEEYTVKDEYRRQLHKMGLSKGYMVLHNGKIVPFEPAP